ncbi:branched-chain amino acid ABC transporter permease, partial [Pseudooctadecabacter sp.]|uniref:branched-chain amino acid ABC transporter permease n=1 Tax=Pseudooctadecabacter sp. TaxID=1966338 RepID=UPI0035C82A65
MSAEFLYGIEVVINGLMAGVMYALVALGFVLIFKASGIFNFAQGVMALFAALTLVGIMEGQVPFSHLFNAIFGTEIHQFGWEVPAVLAILLTVGVMVAFAWAVQRFLFRHLVGQEPIILFMATIGLAYFLEGMGDLMWGSDIKTLALGLPQGGARWIEDATAGLGGDDFYGFFIDKLDIVATGVAIVLVTGLILFSQYTKHGRAMRAVADDHQAALSVGISLNFIWILVWSLAGFVALVAGIMWGAKSGVQFSLSLIALKALPVLMLGGFTSIPGAIVGGLIIGVGEKLFE